MPKTKEIGKIVDNWKKYTAVHVDDYLTGIQNPRNDWATATAAAETNWKAGLTAAQTAGRFAKGVAKSGTAYWKEKATVKGRSRWPEGVAVGDQNYSAGITPYLQVITATDIGPKYAAGDPRNIERVRKLADALHKKKLSG
jgi:hypothetical protein